VPDYNFSVVKATIAVFRVKIVIAIHVGKDK
jgi:hypothetical protein